ncbi:PASTA domain-containing protein [Methanolobus sp. ZRKC3]|uniref:PASTA domain-containing protein n=1 Tax=Methanolobus sp. ZRKC3 TaxID=3125786 RepID=UPI00324F18FE
MSNITDLKQNIERLNKSTTATSKRQSYALVQKSIEGVESEFEAVREELTSKTDTLEQLKKENLVLKQDYTILNSRVQVILREKEEAEKKLEKLSRTRPELSSANLVKAFSDSFEKMGESINSSSSRVNYGVNSMNIKLKTNIAVQGSELRFQFPKADDIIPADNLSELEFTIRSSPKEPEFSSYVDVPDVMGMGLDAAISTLKNAGFAKGEIIEKDSDIAQGTVLSQMPSGSSVAKSGDAVDLVISKITSVAVPNVVGMTLASAKKTLSASNLSTGKVTEKADSSKAGTVLSQSISSGEFVDIGTSIDIVIAVSRRGPV